MRVDVRGARIGSRKARLHQRLRIVGALCKCDQSEGARRAPTVPAGSGRQYAPFCRPRQAWSASNVENTARSDRPGQPEQLRADVEFRNRAGMQVENWAILQIGKHFMRIANAVLAITVYSSPFAICLAQGIQASKTPTTASAAQPAAPAVSAVTPAAAPTTPTASSLLQPSLDTVRQALSGLKVERWKRGSVRDEANTDINSIVVDLQQRVPGLLKDADACAGNTEQVVAGVTPRGRPLRRAAARGGSGAHGGAGRPGKSVAERFGQSGEGAVGAGRQHGTERVVAGEAACRLAGDGAETGGVQMSGASATA